jgi:ribulose-phosphate 3-epimerase
MKISASLMCADLMNLERDLHLLEEAGIEYIHMDVMDGHFVPNLMLMPDMVRRARAACRLPFDIHLMVEQPERFLPLFPAQPGDLVSVHCESTPHLQRALAMIHETGAGAGAALNPGTPLTAIQEVLPDLDFLLVMTVNPGFAGQKLVPQTLDKVRRARTLLDEAGLSGVPIEVDGNCSFENAPKMTAAGAEILVAGTSSVFQKGLTIAEGAQKLRECAL